MTSVICQEFGCLPSQAEEEDFVACLDIIALRRFAEAWQAVDAGMTQEELNKRFGRSKALENVLLVQVKRAKGELI